MFESFHCHFFLKSKTNKMEILNAINKKHQSQVRKAVKALIKYNALNDLRNRANDNGEEKEIKRLDNLCSKFFDKYLEFVDMLPKREVKNIENLFYWM